MAKFISTSVPTLEMSSSLVPVNVMGLDNTGLTAFLHIKPTVKPETQLPKSCVIFHLQEVGQSVCANPGRMAKGQVGGTFTRLVVNYKANTSEQSKTFAESVSAEIVRI